MILKKYTVYAAKIYVIFYWKVTFSYKLFGFVNNNIKIIKLY